MKDITFFATRIEISRGSLDSISNIPVECFCLCVCCMNKESLRMLRQPKRFRDQVLFRVNTQCSIGWFHGIQPRTYIYYSVCFHFIFTNFFILFLLFFFSVSLYLLPLFSKEICAKDDTCTNNLIPDSSNRPLELQENKR